MRHFIAVVHKEPDSCFGVHFPDAPGCYSAAEALDDIPGNAAEALALYFEDREVPEPRGLGALREAAAEDIAEGAFLIAVLLVVPSTNGRGEIASKASTGVTTAASVAGNVLSSRKSGNAAKSSAASAGMQRPNKKKSAAASALTRRPNKKK